MDLIFHGPLGMELSLNKSTGVARVKAAEADSPAQLVVGRALTAIEGVPVGEIRDKKSWLAVVAKLQAPERPLSLTFEAPAAPPTAAPPPEDDPIAAGERARAEAAASAPAPTRGRAYSRGGPRSRSPSPELTCEQCGRKGTRADGFFNGARGNGYRGLFCSEACQAKSAGRSGLERASKRAPVVSSSRRQRRARARARRGDGASRRRRAAIATRPPLRRQASTSSDRRDAISPPRRSQRLRRSHRSSRSRRRGRVHSVTPRSTTWS